MGHRILFLPEVVLCQTNPTNLDRDLGLPTRSFRKEFCLLRGCITSKGFQHSPYVSVAPRLVSFSRFRSLSSRVLEPPIDLASLFGCLTGIMFNTYKTIFFGQPSEIRAFSRILCFHDWHHLLPSSPHQKPGSHPRFHFASHLIYHQILLIAPPKYSHSCFSPEFCSVKRPQTLN